MAKKAIKPSDSSDSDKDAIWMIREKGTGLFANGKMYPRFLVNGKIWNTHPQLLAHLTMMEKHVGWGKTWGNKEPHPYKNCEIIKCRRTITVEVTVDCIGYGE